MSSQRNPCTDCKSPNPPNRAQLGGNIPTYIRFGGRDFPSMLLDDLWKHLIWQLKRLVTLLTYRRYINNYLQYLSIYVRAVVWECRTDRHTDRRAWPIYISCRLRLTRNVIMSIILKDIQYRVHYCLLGSLLNIFFHSHFFLLGL